MGRSIALALCLIAAFALAWSAERPPSPAPANAPATSFSAARAFPDVEIIAKAPHPIGSPQNVAVRDYLIQRMTALGLEPQIQRAEALFERKGRRDIAIAGGQVGPMATRLKDVVEEEGSFYKIIQSVLVAHLHGNAAQISVEIGRGDIPSTAQPSFSEMEEALAAAPAE